MAIIGGVRATGAESEDTEIMSYSGAAKAKEAREGLGTALEALQQDSDIPEDVMAVAQNIAKAVGALFEAERASSEPDGKACVKNALGSLSQTLALLQDVTQHNGIEVATEVLAKAMSLLYPLTTVPSMAPSATPHAPTASPAVVPAAAPVPREMAAPPQAMPAAAPRAPSSPPIQAPVPSGPRAQIEANIGATTESNFYVGFSGEVSEGGVFMSTYETLAKGTSVTALVTLPGGFEFKSDGFVRFVQDPLDFNSEAEPGMGIQFENLDPGSRDLVLRFIRKRAPIFYDE